MFTVEQNLDKHFKLNGLDKAKDTIRIETVVVFLRVFWGVKWVDQMLSSKLLYTGTTSPFSITSRNTAASDISLAELIYQFAVTVAFFCISPL